MFKDKRIKLLVWSLISVIVISALLPVFISMGKNKENKVNWNKVDALIGTEVTPYAMYDFNDSANPWKSTGTAENCDLVARGMVVHEDGSMARFDRKGMLYLPEERNFFKTLTEFTIVIDFCAEKGVTEHSALFSWDYISDKGIVFFEHK